MLHQRFRTAAVLSGKIRLSADAAPQDSKIVSESTCGKSFWVKNTSRNYYFYRLIINSYDIIKMQVKVRFFRYREKQPG